MFANKTSLIIGASTGLGKALASRLANENSNIALMSRNISKLKEAAFLHENKPLFIAGDITSEADCKSAINNVIKHYGQLDYLVLNAGISMWSHFENLSDLSAIHQLIQTNYIGAVNCTYHALHYLKKTNGLITVISSIQGKLGVPYHTGYAASKHALEGFFNSLRIELNNQIDILMVSPGWIKGTELKQHALGKQPGKTIKPTSKQAISLETCCNEIINAMIKRKRDVIIPKKYSFLPWLKLFMPSFLDSIIKKRV